MIDRLYGANAQWHTRQAARPCCRAYGTTCPPCRKWDYEHKRLRRWRNAYDALRVALGR